MKRVLWLSLFLLAMATLPGILLAQAPDTITVTGTVVNETPGGAVPQGAPVSVRFFNAGEWTAVYTTTLAADGTFSFEEVAPESGGNFIARMAYQGIPYFSEPRSVTTSITDVHILIFEPTADPANVQIDQGHLFIVPLEERLYVAEHYLLGNTGERAYTGAVDPASGERATLYFSPPEGATGLTFEGPGLGERFVGDERRFADTRAIPPGSATIEVSFSYELPYHEGQTIARVFEAPVRSLALVVNSDSLGLEGEGLVAAGAMDTQMGPAVSYGAGPLAASEPLAFTLVPMTQEGQVTSATTMPRQPRQRDATGEVGIGIMALAIAGIAVYALWQPPAAPPMPAEARPLVEEIAALDARFADGELDESTYRQQRESLKHQLRVRLRQRRLDKEQETA